MNEKGNAPGIEDLPVIGSIATMPTRTETFWKMIHGALSQVDELFVFLDGFDEVPADFSKLPRCHPSILPKQGNLHASSRFLAPRLFGSDAIVVLFDDDILYPPDYVSRLKSALVRYQGKVVVGFHGSIFTPPHQSYVRDRRCFEHAMGLDMDMVVHVVGCGTIAFVSSEFKPDPEKWTYANMNDLYVAAEAIRANLLLIALQREAGWIKALATDQKDSIWMATRRDDRAQSYLMRDLLTQYVKPTWNDWWKPS